MNACRAIHDDGKADDLVFDVSDCPGLVELAHAGLASHRQANYLAHLSDCVRIAAKRHTQAEMDVIDADQARRIRAMGNK